MEGNLVAVIPDVLFHTLLTVVNYEADSTGSIRTVYPLGTHTDLASAKDFSRHALSQLGYASDDFEAYEERPANENGDGGSEWKHDDGILVYARRPGPHDFLISIATTPNNEDLPPSEDGHAHVRLPNGANNLHYVLQTKIDYNIDRSGQVQTTEVEGVFAHRMDAVAAARNCLVSSDITRNDYAQYDERDEASMANEWPFGESVVVHAVAQTGENYLVAVRTVPEAHGRILKAPKGTKKGI